MKWLFDGKYSLEKRIAWLAAGLGGIVQAVLQIVTILGQVPGN